MTESGKRKVRKVDSRNDWKKKIFSRNLFDTQKTQRKKINKAEPLEGGTEFWN